MIIKKSFKKEYLSVYVLSKESSLSEYVNLISKFHLVLFLQSLSFGRALRVANQFTVCVVIVIISNKILRKFRLLKCGSVYI